MRLCWSLKAVRLARTQGTRQFIRAAPKRPLLLAEGRVPPCHLFSRDDFKSKSTRIGVAVNAVRKQCSDEEVVALAKILIKNWKRLLESSGTPKREKALEGQKNKKEKSLDFPSWQPEGANSHPVKRCKSPAEKHKEKDKERDFPNHKAVGPLPGSKKHSSDQKQDRKSSKSGSHTAAPKSHSADSKPDRETSDCRALPATSKKSHSDGKKERRPSTGSNPTASPPGSRKNSSDGKEERPNSAKSKPEPPKTPSSPSSPTFAPTIYFLASCYLTGDSVRDKCVEMISAALKMDDDYKQFGVNCDKMASEIEDHILWLAGLRLGLPAPLGLTDMKYRNRVRSRISNLKDPKNPNLRRNVLNGAISPSLIARMTAEEMASDELKELRNAMTLEAIREHQMAKTGGTTTDLFQCGKCKKKNCTYNQVQTRSADEPMTTFVLCNECGNRWKGHLSVGLRTGATESPLHSARDRTLEMLRSVAGAGAVLLAETWVPGLRRSAARGVLGFCRLFLLDVFVMLHLRGSAAGLLTGGVSAPGWGKYHEKRPALPFFQPHYKELLGATSDTHAGKCHAVWAPPDP
ncbi:Transcription elongation factor A protein 3 [Platysternon megacephalum]|uniref:Transcription elongation factor A protein 3 n=1 Tax=Platysternon megacephalum TaxID=55544 RepID=A0A4D9ERD2_9SAUR|nr:Transcription elongation factor A protein 3 [Platysternon megacephalum]